MNSSQTSAPDSIVREQLVALLTGRNAHASFEDSVADLPAELRGVKPEQLPYTIWQLVDHIRIAQSDILEFSRDPDYQSPAWPAGYWTKELAPADEAAWQQALDQIRQDRDAFIALLLDSNQDLYTPFAHGKGQNLLRETLLIADHNAYHVGEIIIIRRLLNAWS
jgi:hypothetical protein